MKNQQTVYQQLVAGVWDIRDVGFDIVWDLGF
jgi:hypothetical protein